MTNEYSIRRLGTLRKVDDLSTYCAWVVPPGSGVRNRKQDRRYEQWSRSLGFKRRNYQHLNCTVSLLWDNLWDGTWYFHIPVLPNAHGYTSPTTAREELGWNMVQWPSCSPQALVHPTTSMSGVFHSSQHNMNPKQPEIRKSSWAWFQSGFLDDINLVMVFPLMIYPGGDTI